MDRYFLFCFPKETPGGGLNDYVESFGSLGDAEQFLISGQVFQGDRAHIAYLDAGGDLETAGYYEHSRVVLNSVGEKSRGNRNNAGRWIKELDDDRYTEVVTLHGK